MRILTLILAALTFLPGLLAADVAFAAQPLSGKIVLPANHVGASFQTLRKWLLFGPMRVTDLEEDALFARYGVQETEIGRKIIDGELTPNSSAKQDSGEARILSADVDETVDLLKLYQIKFSYITERRIAYAMCNIEADQDGEYYLLLTSDDTLKLWINDKCVAHSKEGRAMSGYSEMVPVRLNRGKNLCVAKIGNFSGGWGFGAGVAGDLERALEAFLDSGGVRLKKLMYRPDEVVDLACALPREAARRFVTLNYIGGSTASGIVPGDSKPTLNTNEVRGRDGLYDVKFVVCDKAFHETILFGDAEKYLPFVRSFLASQKLSDNVRDSLKTIVRRLEILTKAENIKKEDMNWQHKIVTLVGNALQVMKLNHGSDRAFRGATGLHFGSFVSSIDGSEQHYRIYVPTRYKNTDPLGLVVILPTNVLRNVPYIESALVADELEARAFAEAGERSGVGILWSGYRCRPYGNPGDFVHFDEVLADVGKDYSIDSRRIALLGTCSSGTLAAMFVVKWPERFSAVGLVNPFLHRMQNRWDERSEFRDNNAYKKWIEVNDPLPAVAQVKDVSFRIVQNIDDPDHGPLWQPRELLEAAKAAGNGNNYEMRTLFFSSENMQAIWQKELIPWLAQIVRPSASSRCMSCAAGQSTISGALSEPFVVVVGVSGSIDETIENRNAAYAFQAQWRRTHFGGCRLVEDLVITRKEIEEYNLVIVGKRSSNLVWDRVVDCNDVVIDSAGVTVYGRRIQGDSLGVQVRVRSAANSKRSVVVLATNASQAKFGTLDLAIDGWYKCAVWKTLDGATSLLDAW